MFRANSFGPGWAWKTTFTAIAGGFCLEEKVPHLKKVILGD